MTSLTATTTATTTLLEPGEGWATIASKKRPNKVLTPRGGAAAQASSVDEHFLGITTLPRGTEEADVRASLAAALDHEDCDQEKLEDLFVLAMHMRDARGGRGERTIGMQLLQGLALRGFSDEIARLVPLFPEYGCYKDLSELVSSESAPLRESALAVLRAQLIADQEAERPSLAAKWAPREGSNKRRKAAAKQLASACFPESTEPLAEYRKMVAGLNRRLKTVEISQCDHDWANIEPSHVPAKHLTMRRKAFLNEKISKKRGPAEIRFPDDEDRMACRQKFLDVAANQTGKKGLKGRAAQPHELVRDYITAQLEAVKEDDKSTVEPDVILEAQWESLRSKLQGECGEGLGKLVPIVDVSEAMSEESLAAAVSLAVLASETCHPTFRNRVLTFSERPAWVQLGDTSTLAEKCSRILASRSGRVKNLEAAVEAILQVCVGAKVPAEEVQDLRLLVLSDMDFETAWRSCKNQAAAATEGEDKYWSTQHEVLAAAFAEAGYPSLPEVVYWNLNTKLLRRGETLKVPGLQGKLHLELASDSAGILCGACLVFGSQQGHLCTVHYAQQRLNGPLAAHGSAVQHSGDQQINGKSVHTIDIDLGAMPPNADQIFFTLCSCGPADLSAFNEPFISLADGKAGGNFCRYHLSDAAASPTALMAALIKGADGRWNIVAIGENATMKCCGNYSEVIQKAGRHSKVLCMDQQAADPASSGTALTVQGGLPGVELLSGYSADMLVSLVNPEADAAVTTPAEKLMRTLQGKRYDAVRRALVSGGQSGPEAAKPSGSGSRDGDMDARVGAEE